MESKKRNSTVQSAAQNNRAVKRKEVKKASAKRGSSNSILKEPKATYSTTSRIRPIGNSKGVILSNRVMEEAGISPEAELTIQVAEGMILIAAAKPPTGLNTDLSSWDKQFRKAIKMGNSPEKDLWNGLPNKFDEEGWT